MTGHNSDEGLLFASPFVKTNREYERYLRTLLPALSNMAVSTISNKLYPAIFNGSFGYTDQLGRLDLTLAEATIVCNARFLDNAFDESYAYEFSVNPGIHLAELAYTFYDPAAGAGVNVSLAKVMQAYFTEFAAKGSPDGPGLPLFPTDENWTVQNLNSTNFGPMKDPASAKRCAWWQTALHQ